ncbi:transmembrane protein 134-like [Eriocheir sinensis]|uniref:transmembrane protein 134-like n=1 Tax=Eriocheir sinensis TaxID=95602 RepID=UPI0021C8595F|nr:transmembrane protein 134-like [Eriocheir sinensis]
MSRQPRGRPTFSIEDAFEEEPEDVVRMYGATTERSPLKPKGGTAMEDSGGARGADSGGGKSLMVLPDVDAVSRDSDSLIPGDGGGGGGGAGYGSSQWWFRHPKVREKWRVVAAAFVLLLVGLVLLVVGIVVEAVPLESLSGSVFIIAGLICFIPGAYHVVYVLLAVWGRRGYDFYNLPLFN